MLIENLELKGKECREIFVSCKNGQSFQYVDHNFINEFYLTGIACVKNPIRLPIRITVLTGFLMHIIHNLISTRCCILCSNNKV